MSDCNCDLAGCDIGRDYNPYAQCDGTATCPRHGDYARGIAEGERRERAAVVAAAVRKLARYRWACGSDTLEGLAGLLDAIEAGEHKETT